jgi:hypothetical protein
MDSIDKIAKFYGDLTIVKIITQLKRTCMWFIIINAQISCRLVFISTHILISSACTYYCAPLWKTQTTIRLAFLLGNNPTRVDHLTWKADSTKFFSYTRTRTCWEFLRHRKTRYTHFCNTARRMSSSERSLPSAPWNDSKSSLLSNMLQLQSPCKRKSSGGLIFASFIPFPRKLARAASLVPRVSSQEASWGGIFTSLYRRDIFKKKNVAFFPVALCLRERSSDRSLNVINFFLFSQTLVKEARKTLLDYWYTHMDGKFL